MEILIILQEKYVETEFHKKMNKSLHQYDHSLGNETTNKAWDHLQRSFQCCGIMNYTDWSSNDIDIPFSCCKEINNQSCKPEEMFNGNKTKGQCCDSLVDYFLQNSASRGHFWWKYKSFQKRSISICFYKRSQK